MKCFKTVFTKTVYADLKDIYKYQLTNDLEINLWW